MEKGASPMPGISSMMNWPGLKGKVPAFLVVDDPDAVQVLHVRELVIRW